MCRMVRDGYFGFKDYFKSLCDTVEDGGDFYLLGYDFARYLEAQVIFSNQYVIANTPVKIVHFETDRIC